MKLNKWTLALAATGVVSVASAVQADEHPVNTLLSSTTLYGYVDTSAIWNFGRGNGGGANRSLNTGPDRQDGFNLNAVKVALEKPLDEGTWSAGYKVETIYGADAAYYAPGRNFAIKQAYVALRVPVGNGLDFKVGKFDPIIGYEVFDSYANPNFSRSLGYALEPAAHIGVLATYQITDVFGVAAGVGNSALGNGIDTETASNAAYKDESRKTYMAGITVKAPESTGWASGSSLYLGILDTSYHSTPTGRSKDKLNLYAGGTLATPIKGFTVGAAWDHASVDDAYDAWTVAGYVGFQFNEQLKFNGRVEWGTSNGGLFTSGAGGSKEDIFALTGTVDYQLFANVITRAEVRWDHASRGRFWRTSGYSTSFAEFTPGIDDVPEGGGTPGGTTGGIRGLRERDDLSALINIIYRF